MFKNFIVAALFSVFSLGTAHAETLDFTDGLYDVLIVNAFGPAMITKEAGGVEFRITGHPPAETDLLFGSGNGVRFGDTLFGTSFFFIDPQSPVRITGFTGRSTSLVGDPDLELRVGRSIVGVPSAILGSVTFPFTGATIPFDPIEVDTGSIYVDRFPFLGNGASGFLTGIEFERIAAVPLPAGFPMLLAGLGAFALARRKG